MRAIIFSISLILFYLTGSGQTLDSLLFQAEKYYDLGRYDEAFTILENATEICLANGNDSLAIDCHIRSSKTLLKQNKYHDIHQTIQSVNNLSPGYYQKAQLALLESEAYLKEGATSKSLASCTSALDCFNKQAHKDTLTLSQIYNQLGLIHWYQGNFELAERYIKSSLDLRMDKYGEKSIMVADSYNNLGLIMANEEIKQSKKFYEKALVIYQKKLGQNHEKSGLTMANLAGIELRKENFFAALNLYEDLLPIWKRHYGELSPQVAFIHASLADVNKRLGSYDLAHNHIDSTILIYNRLFGNKHPELASAYNVKGQLFIKQDDYKAALPLFQDAMIANCPGFESTAISNNPTISTSWYHGTTLANSLYLKAKALQLLHTNRTLKISDLKMAYATIMVADSLLNILRAERHSDQDKIKLGSLSQEIYEVAVYVSYRLSKATWSPDFYYNRVFYFTERSKAAVLYSAIQDTRAKKFAGIPSELIAQEDSLQKQITTYNEQLLNTINTDVEGEFRKKLLETQEEYLAFIDKLEHQYPAYYKLKYEVDLPSVATLQKTLSEKDIVYSYFISEGYSTIYLSILTNDDFKVVTILPDEKIKRTIMGYQNSLLYQVSDILKETSNDLYSQLLPVLPNKDKDHIIIIPHEYLQSVPFEALFKGDLEKSHYLIQDYAISYAFSANLLIQKESSEISGNKTLLMAPVTFEYTETSFPELKGTLEEVTTISRNLESKNIPYTALLRKQATEDYFRTEDLTSYSFIHLATHGMVNASNPNRSLLCLAPGKEDGFLYNADLYNIKINADLVTLSACETGLGQNQSGEGIIGLSRALSYAGAKNLIVSYWAVSDAATQQLMSALYKHILALPEIPYAYHLQAAKLEVLKNNAYQDPYYWAAFTLLGY